jgi:hypothetical protein
VFAENPHTIVLWEIADDEPGKSLGFVLAKMLLGCRLEFGGELMAEGGKEIPF